MSDCPYEESYPARKPHAELVERIKALEAWFVALRDGIDTPDAHCLPLDKQSSHRYIVDQALAGCTPSLDRETEKATARQRIKALEAALTPFVSAIRKFRLEGLYREQLDIVTDTDMGESVTTSDLLNAEDALSGGTAALDGALEGAREETRNAMCASLSQAGIDFTYEFPSLDPVSARFNNRSTQRQEWEQERDELRAKLAEAEEDKRIFLAESKAVIGHLNEDRDALAAHCERLQEALLATKVKLRFIAETGILEATVEFRKSLDEVIEQARSVLATTSATPLEDYNKAVRRKVLEELRASVASPLPGDTVDLPEHQRTGIVLSVLVTGMLMVKITQGIDTGAVFGIMPREAKLRAEATSNSRMDDANEAARLYAAMRQRLV